jgi:hypothetical protein
MSELNPNEKLIVSCLIENHRIVSRAVVILTVLSSVQVRRIFMSLLLMKKIIAMFIGKGVTYEPTNHTRSIK